MEEAPITVVVRAVLFMAVVAGVAFLLARPPAGEAHHLCGATGSPLGAFDIETYEAEDYGYVYARTLELAGNNVLFPDLEAFAVPPLGSGDREAGSAFPVAGYIPPVLLKAIGVIESGWAQADWSVPYGAVGDVLASHDCGYGIMQITSGMQNVTGVPNLEQAMIGGHFAFNIARGANILGDKWNLAPEVRPIVGERVPTVAEDWYFALWGYNGFAFKNHPLNPDYSAGRVAFSCGPQGDGFSHDRTRYPYQELVLGCVQHPAVRGGEPLWEPQDVLMPDLTDPAFADPLNVANWNACALSASCAAMDIPTPLPLHIGATTSGALRNEVIGAPAIFASPANVEIVTAPGVSSGAETITILNSGSGVLAYRATATAPWIKLSRHQGVALGADMGLRLSSIEVTADVTGLPPGQYSGEVIIDSLYAEGAPQRIPVVISSLWSAALITGAGDEVYSFKSGIRRWIPNRATFEANEFDWDEVVSVADSSLASIPIGNPLPDVLADGNLLAGSGDEVYVMEGRARRHITSPSVMGRCGFSFADIRTLTAETLGGVPGGAPLTDPPCPRLSPEEGSLIQSTGTDPAVYVVRGGLRRHIPDPITLEALSYVWANIDKVGGSLIAGVPVGRPLSSVRSDGTLLRDDGHAIYVMQSGLKRHILSPLVLAACGYVASTAHVVSSSRLNAIQTGLLLAAPPCPHFVPDEGSLFQEGTGPVFVMNGQVRRHVPDRATFESNGFLAGNVDLLHDSMITAIANGDPLLSVLADGNVITSPTKPVYVMDGGTRRPLASGAMVACGYGGDSVHGLTDGRLLQIPQGSPLAGPPCPQVSPADGRLISGAGSEVYVMHNQERRHIVSRQVFDGCFYRWGNISNIPPDVLSSIPQGLDLIGPPCPRVSPADGALVAGEGPEVYVMHNRERRHIVSRQVFDGCLYRWGDVINIPPDVLSSILRGPDVIGPPCPWVLPADGTLVAGEGPEVYVMHNRERRHIISRQVFDGCLYRWGDVSNIPSEVLSLMPQGPDLIGPPCP